jgi:alanine racemase
MTPACVVKADAYGHGDCVVVPFLEELGIKFFCVSSLYEALSLRSFGVTGEILILGYTPPDEAKTLSERGITQAVFSPEYAEELLKNAEKDNAKVKCHIVIDSGMNRIGFQEFDESTLALLKNKALDINGVFTHFSSADMFDDESIEYTDSQQNFFKKTVENLINKGFEFKYIHSFNSAAALTRESDFGNLCRLGIVLYGLSPSEYDYDIDLKPVMSFRSVISMIKTLPKGKAISYGRQFVTEKETKVATVACGYADGYDRLNGNKTEVLIRGKRCKVIGRVCMDQFMVDVTGLPEVKAGDEVILFGEDITADEVAEIGGTVNYDIVCAVGRRVPRVFIKNNKIYKTATNEYKLTEVKNG